MYVFPGANLQKTMEVAKESLQNSLYYPFFWFLQVFSLPFKKNSVNLHTNLSKAHGHTP